MGSGKTTLVKNIANSLKWTIAPQNNPAKRYLNDLFKDMERWAFEAQIGFLTTKALEVSNLISENVNFILDRSIYEDYKIFAQFFFDNGKIDPRSFETYSSVAQYFTSRIPAPDLLIYCECSLHTAKQRIKDRKRNYQDSYPENHMEQIKESYNKWIKNFKDCPVYKIDSDIFDFRNLETMNLIIDDIVKLLNSKTTTLQQLDIFTSHIHRPKLNVLKEIISIEIFQKEKTNPIKHLNPSQNIQSPYAYIAAPFTSKAIEKPKKNDEGFLFNESPLHGVIATKSKYREMLLGISRNLRTLGINSVIPHRDVSKWGKVFVSAQQVFDNCTTHVANCNLFVGLLGESSGSHYEFGLAYADNKPIILIQCAEISNSYLSLGIQEENKRIKILRCKKITQISRLFRTKEVIEFITFAL